MISRLGLISDTEIREGLTKHILLKGGKVLSGIKISGLVCGRISRLGIASEDIVFIYVLPPGVWVFDDFDNRGIYYEVLLDDMDRLGLYSELLLDDFDDKKLYQEIVFDDFDDRY